MKNKEQFEIWTDHENLKYFRKLHKLNGQQARQYLKLQDYDFILWHILEKANTKANILSRKDQVNTQDNNKDVQMLKDELWTRRTIAEVAVLQRKKAIENSSLSDDI